MPLFILLGVVVQMAILFATFKFVPRGEGWFSGFGQIMWYVLYLQWIGYIIQFVIVWHVINKQFWKSIAICFLTIVIMFLGFELYFNDNKVAKHVQVSDE